MRQYVIYPRLQRRRAVASPEGDMGRLASLPFWCGDNALHLRHPDDYADNGCCVNHAIGLPVHPATKKPMPLTPYQVDVFEQATGRTAGAEPGPRADPERPRLIHNLKARQMGFTEIFLRIMFFECLHHYAGSKVGIMAATNGRLARQDLRRFAALWRPFPSCVERWPTAGLMRLANGTTIEAFPASEEAMTGDTKYKCIMLDEAAKWRLVDDLPVFNSIMPIVRTNAADLWLISTPKGPVKMFYDVYKEPGDFRQLKYDIWAAEGNMYTKQEIEHLLATSNEDPEQEYLCKFTLGRDAVFGEVLESERDEVEEWH